MTILLKTVGAIISVFALLGCLISVHGLISPAALQLANELDPFGIPPGAPESLLHLAVFAAILASGLWLMSGSRRTS